MADFHIGSDAASGIAQARFGIEDTCCTIKFMISFFCADNGSEPVQT